MKNILITGGSGLVGTRLTEILLAKGYTVSHLSRHVRQHPLGIPVYRWAIPQSFIDNEAIRQADAIIHLAGAGVADRFWTKQRKKMIVDSRVDSSNLLFMALQRIPNKVQAFISASAIGYYGNRGDEWLEETALPSHDFLGETTQLWEKAVNQLSTLDIRTACLRIGIVLSTKGGALPKTDLPVKWGVKTILGNGRQYYSWIHLDDLCRLFLYALENKKIAGAYNAVAPNPVPHHLFVETIATALQKKGLALTTPAFLLRWTLGDMANIVLHSTKVSSNKIQQAGFSFAYPHLLPALQHIYANNI